MEARLSVIPMACSARTHDAGWTVDGQDRERGDCRDVVLEVCSTRFRARLCRQGGGMGEKVGETFTAW